MPAVQIEDFFRQTFCDTNIAEKSPNFLLIAMKVSVYVTHHDVSKSTSVSVDEEKSFELLTKLVKNMLFQDLKRTDFTLHTEVLAEAHNAIKNDFDLRHAVDLNGRDKALKVSVQVLESPSESGETPENTSSTASLADAVLEASLSSLPVASMVVDGMAVYPGPTTQANFNFYNCYFPQPMGVYNYPPILMGQYQVPNGPSYPSTPLILRVPPVRQAQYDAGGAVDSRADPNTTHTTSTEDAPMTPCASTTDGESASENHVTPDGASAPVPTPVSVPEPVVVADAVPTAVEMVPYTYGYQPQPAQLYYNNNAAHMMYAQYAQYAQYVQQLPAVAVPTMCEPQMAPPLSTLVATPDRPQRAPQDYVTPTRPQPQQQQQQSGALSRRFITPSNHSVSPASANGRRRFESAPSPAAVPKVYKEFPNWHYRPKRSPSEGSSPVAAVDTAKESR